MQVLMNKWEFNMIKIAVFTGDVSKSQEIFQQTKDSVRSLHNNCEITFVRESAQLEKNLEVFPLYYDIYIFDSANEDCLKISHKIRSSNLIASIIYIVHNNVKQLLRVIKYRPSQVLSEDVKAEELQVALKYCIGEQNRCRPYFTVKTRDSLKRIKYGDILYFESNQRKISLHTSKQIIEFYGKLNDVEALLPMDSFVRTHQSYIINMERISELDKVSRFFKLDNGTMIEISKSQYSYAAEKYEKYAENR